MKKIVTFLTAVLFVFVVTLSPVAAAADETAVNEAASTERAKNIEDVWNVEGVQNEDIWSTETNAQSTEDVWSTETSTQSTEDVWSAETNTQSTEDVWSTETSTQSTEDIWSTETSTQSTEDVWSTETSTENTEQLTTEQPMDMADFIAAQKKIVINKVQNIKVTATSYNSVKLSWERISNVTGYRVYRSSNGKDFSCIKTLKGSNGLTYSDKKLTTGRTYYYKVRAYIDKSSPKKRYYGTMSDIVKIKPTLDKMTIKSLTSPSAKKMKITWAKVSGAKGYRIYQATSLDGTYEKIKTITSVSTLSYTKSNLVEGQTYYYKMRAYTTVNGVNKYGPYSDIKEVKIKKLDKDKAKNYLNEMTLEEKVAQLFVVTPESITGVSRAVQAGTSTKNAIKKYPVGGLIYFAQNIKSKQQFVKMLKNTQSFMKSRTGMKAFMAIDEEGGSVARISGNPNTGVAALPDMSKIGATKNTTKAYETGKKISNILSEFQINLDFAPVADVANVKNSIMLKRSFGSDPNLVGDMVAAQVRAFKEKNIICSLKHFPGLGFTTGDTHKGYVKTNKTREQMRECEFIPFKKGIDAGADLVMIGHVSAPNMIGDDTPASLSKLVVTDILRGEMGFDGVIVTDALNMGGVSNYYTSEQATVMALEAGVDILLMPENFVKSYNEVLKAVRSGRITEERIDQSVYRILKLKVEKGLA